MAKIERLMWDTWNVDHIARHGVVPEEVAQVCAADPVVRATYGERLLAIGPTLRGRMLTVVLAPEENNGYYVVTARPADRKERARYASERGGTAI